MSGGAGALSPRLPVGLWLRWFPPTTAFGAGPSPGGRALLRLGLLLKMFFGPTRGHRSKMALYYVRQSGKKSPNPVDKHVGPPGAHAPHDACNEPRKTGRCARPHVPAGAEIREGY